MSKNVKQDSRQTNDIKVTSSTTIGRAKPHTRSDINVDSQRSIIIYESHTVDAIDIRYHLPKI